MASRNCCCKLELGIALSLPVSSLSPHLAIAVVVYGFTCGYCYCAILVCFGWICLNLAVVSVCCGKKVGIVLVPSDKGMVMLKDKDFGLSFVNPNWLHSELVYN